MPSRVQELREVALRLFRERGYHATSMQDLADGMGIYKGSLYHYIRSKAELLAWLLEGALEETLEELERVAVGEGSAAGRLRGLVRAYALAVVRNLDAVGVYLREWRALPSEDLARVRRQRRAMRELFERVIADGASRREFAVGDAKVAALAVLGMCNWLYEWYRPNGRLPAEAVADELAERALASLRG